MTKRNQDCFSKHLDFVTLLRSSMHIPEKEVGTIIVVADNDTENEANIQLMKELEAKFDALFGSLD